MEKPKIFIGSSAEGLDIAYAIQENLDFVAETTIWDQGIFNLTTTTLDDLLKTLERSDIGIFVFSPDDIIKIRDNQYKTTRDNVIFEFGLFLGYLGKERVSYVIPKAIFDFHLPSDLSGISPGHYNAERSDNNLKAALGPYCNQIKKVIEKTSIIKLSDFKYDSDIIKRIVIRKPENWEYLLIKEILKVELEALNRIVLEIQYDLYISKPKRYSVPDFFEFLIERGNLFSQLLKAFQENFPLIEESIKQADEVLIKERTLRMVSYGFKALEIEKENKGIIVPNEVLDLKNYLSDWYIPITDFIRLFYENLQLFFNGKNEPIINQCFDIKIPNNIEKINEKIAFYANNPNELNPNQ